MIGFDFADPESGISATLRPGGAAVVFDHDDVLAASAEASAGFEEGEGLTTVGLQLDDVALKLELAPLAAEVVVGDERTGAERLAVCRVLGELEASGRTAQVSCLGIRCEGEPEPAEAALTRSIAVAFSDGGLLALRALRPNGAQTHAEEQVAAVVADPDGQPSELEETLLSTQYDAEGRQVRATLELWPPRDAAPRPARRAAGTIVCGTSLALGEGRLDIAVFRWSMEGRPGLGRYEVLSAAGAA